MAGAGSKLGTNGSSKGTNKIKGGSKKQMTNLHTNKGGMVIKVRELT